MMGLFFAPGLIIRDKSPDGEFQMRPHFLFRYILLLYFVSHLCFF